MLGFTDNIINQGLFTSLSTPCTQIKQRTTMGSSRVMHCWDDTNSVVMTRHGDNNVNAFITQYNVVSRGAMRSAASSYAAMCMVAGSRPVLVIAWGWHIGLTLLCGCSGALEYPTTNSCGPINKSLSLSLFTGHYCDLKPGDGHSSPAILISRTERYNHPQFARKQMIICNHAYTVWRNATRIPVGNKKCCPLRNKDIE